jgi:cyclophilin family peptidyl-prolyl cis-trans isomerase
MQNIMYTLLLGLWLSVSSVWAADTETVVIQTSAGDITLTLDKTRAPKTVANFLSYVDQGFYNGTIFHRVIKNFMIQGGGLTADMQKKATMVPVENEAKNGLKNVRGSIAMARTQVPHSATSQFFINHRDNTNLDYPSFDGWGYAVFGKVSNGLEVVDKIANIATKAQAGRQNVPVKPIIITAIKRITTPSKAD